MSLTQLIKLRVLNDFTIWIDKSSDIYSNYKRFIRDFGNDESIILLYHSDSLASNSSLKLVYETTDSLKALKGVNNVISLSTIEIPSNLIFGPKMLPLIPKTTTNPERLKKKILSYKSYVDFLITADFKTTSFVIIPDSIADKQTLFNQVKIIAKRMLRSNGEFVTYGVLPMKLEVYKISKIQSEIFLSITVLSIFLYCLLIFRSFKKAILPIVIALLSIFWTLGLMAVFGVTMNILVSILPLIIFVISIANVIHFIHNMAGKQNLWDEKNNATLKNFHNFFLKCFYSSFTTAVALFAFSMSDIIPLRHFGLFSSLGIMIAFMLTFILLPILFSWIGFETQKPIINPFEHFIKKINASFLFTNRKIIYSTGAIIFFLSVFGIFKIKVNTNQLTYFKKNDPVSISNSKAEEWLSGVIPYDIIINLDKSFFDFPGTYTKKLYRFENILDKMPEIRSRQSILTILNDYGIIKNDSLSLPTFSSQAKENISMNLKHFVAEDGKSLRLTFKTSWMNDKEEIELMTKIKSAMDTIFYNSKASYYFTGSIPVFAYLSSRLVNSQIKSYLFTFILIFLVFLVLYHNFKISIMGLIPNVLPVVCTIGLMGYLHIPLDVATVLVASVSFGIAVDDTIHFISTYLEFRKESDKFEAINKTFARIGKTLITTSFLLIGGFIIMIFSSYRSFIFMGIFISINVLLALSFDLLLLPAILLYKK